VAKAQLRALSESGYRPQLRPQAIPVAGRSAIATLKAQMINMLEGGHISEHDYLIGSKIATVMCGGEVEPGSLVDEQWLLDLERRTSLRTEERMSQPKKRRRVSSTC
jgi:3-hydroxyacyl-CoA dehydrogenase